MGWGRIQSTLTVEQEARLVDEASRLLAGLSLQAQSSQIGVSQKAAEAIQERVRALGYPQPDNARMKALVDQVVARVTGLGFLFSLMPPQCNEYTDILMNADGSVWARRKGGMDFERIPVTPTQTEAWRVVEALLAPEGRACTEATPTVDVKRARENSIGFGGARIKVIHSRIAPGDGYPVLAVRLFEPRPVPPEQIVAWGVFPKAVMDALLDAVRRRLRVMVIGGTGSGKTTLLSALCHGIPHEARIVKAEDPEEIWLPHPNVVTLEARPAPPGSEVTPYTIADAVDDAMRLAPTYLIVGEVRTGGAALGLFRALMSDHAGLTTFHAEGPREAVLRLSVIMYADMGVEFAAARALFTQAIDLVIHVGWRGGQRRALGIWEVEEAREDRAGQVSFRTLWQPGDEVMQPTKRVRS